MFAAEAGVSFSFYQSQIWALDRMAAVGSGKKR